MYTSSMNTKSRLSLLLIAIVVCTPYLLLAQEATTTDEVVGTSTEEVATSSEPVVETTATPLPPAGGSAPLSPTAQTRLTNLAANVSNSLDGYVWRLENVTNRLTARIAKEEAAGKNMSVAKSALETATNELNTAKAELATIDSEVARFIGSENPRQAWLEVRATYQTAYTAITTAHTATLQAIRAVRQSGLIVPVEPEVGTSTDADTI
jgi:hypothetical protein